jgi:hypothetical protein
MAARRSVKIISGSISIAVGGVGAVFFYQLLRDDPSAEPAMFVLDLIFTALTWILLSSFIHFFLIADAVDAVFGFFNINSQPRSARGKQMKK